MRTKEITIFLFLTLGTILSFCLAFYGWNDMYKLWNYPERSFMYETGLVVLYIDFTLLGIAGIVSIFSYIRKGRAWVLIVKCIIVNIVLLLILPLYISVVLLIFRFFLGLLILIVIAASLFGLWKLWKLIDSYMVKANGEVDTRI